MKMDVSVGRSFSGIKIVLICMIAACFLFAWLPKAKLQTADIAKARENDEPAVTVHAAKRGNQNVNFLDGREIDRAIRPAGQNAQAISEASADFDSDGVADLVAGDAAGGITLYLGSRVNTNDPAGERSEPVQPFQTAGKLVSIGATPDQLFAGDFNADGKKDVLGVSNGGNVLQVLAGDGQGNFSLPVVIPIDGKINAVEVGEIGRQDGQADLAVAYRNKNGSFLAIFEHPEGAFKHPPEIIRLAGDPTAIAIGNLDGDFYADIVLARGTDLTVIHGRGQVYPFDIDKKFGIKRPEPVIATRRMPFSISAMTVGRFGTKRGQSLALLGADGNIYRIGSDRGSSTKNLLPANSDGLVSKYLLMPTESDDRNLAIYSAPQISIDEAEKAGLPMVDRSNGVTSEKKAEQLPEDALRQYQEQQSGDRANSSQTARADQRAAAIRAFVRMISSKASTLANWDLETIAAGSQFASAAASGGSRKMLRVNVSDSDLDDILVLDPSGAQIQLVSQVTASDKEGLKLDGEKRIAVTSLATESGPLTVLPMSLNMDSLSDLIVLQRGSAAPSIVMTAPSANLLVSTTDETGDCLPGNACSLRNAILYSNSHSGVEFIQFVTGPATFTLSQELPKIMDGVSLFGNLNGSGQPTIEISGINVPAPANGLLLRSSNSFIYGLAINGFKSTVSGQSQIGGNGIAIDSTSASPNNGNNTILQTYLGTDRSGSFDKGNDATGLNIFDADNNEIVQNLISGNGAQLKFGYGIAVTGGNSNVFANNIVGLNSLGTGKLGNSQGVFLTGSNNRFGGESSGEGNTVSGNGEARLDYPEQCSGDGMLIPVLVNLDTNELETSGNNILGNRIGTNAAGSLGLGNCWRGINTAPATSTMIGSITEEGRNIVSDNGFDAIWCGSPYSIDTTDIGSCSIAGNNIGTDLTGNLSIPNSTKNEPGGVVPVTAIVYIGNSSTLSYLGSPGGTTPDGACTGFCNLISGNYSPSLNNDTALQVGGLGVIAVYNNFIGTNKNGNRGLPNQNGVSVASTIAANFEPEYYLGGYGSQNGNQVSFGNIISGNQSNGVNIGVGQNTRGIYYVLGNRIGTDSSGTFAVPNGSTGLTVQTGFGYYNTVIGDSDPRGRNIFSGNGVDGISIFFGTNVRIYNNLIGVNSSLAPIPNGGNGIRMAGLWGVGTIVGGEEGENANVIANNGKSGIKVTGGATFYNNFRGNSIYDNGALGIDLSAGNFFGDGDGVTVNDCNDSDLGPNEFQNYPLLLAPVQNPNGTVKVDGTLRSLRNRHFKLDFYSSPVADGSTYGEGAIYIGSIGVETNGNGLASFSFNSWSNASAGSAITATSTDDHGNTSEFSCAAGVCTGGAVTTLEQLTMQMEITCVQPIVVNVEGDQPDPNTGDGVCDVDVNDSELQCTLRAAIQEANARAGYNQINFAIPGTGVHVIDVLSPLPEITGNADIDATTQTGFVDNPLIKLDGFALGGTGTGLKVTGNNTTIAGFSIVAFQYGISLVGGGGNTVKTCYLGINADGSTGPPEKMDIGLEIRDGSSNNWIGGASDGDVNVMSNNHAGLIIKSGSNNNHVLNGRFGVNRTGLSTFANEFGVVLDNANNNFIGDDRSVAPNLISGNTQYGVVLQNNSSLNNVDGSYIGVNPVDPGNAAFGNGLAGIIIDGGSSRNTIGNVETGKSNVIGNHRTTELTPGIWIRAGAGNENSIVRNQIGVARQTPQDPFQVASNGLGILIERSGQTIGSGDLTAINGNFVASNVRSGIAVDGSVTAINGINIRGNVIGSDGTTSFENGGSGIVVKGDVTNAKIFGNFISGNAEWGIALVGGYENTIYANVIGTNGDGNVAVPNVGGGILVVGDDNTIGGTGETGPNLISGNTGPGVRIDGGSVHNTLRRNLIGTDKGASTFVRNMGGGVIVHGSENILKENVISGNALFGVGIGRDSGDPAEQNNHLVANNIGVSSDGSSEIANGYGVIMVGGTSNNIVEKGNVISGNHLDGIYVEAGSIDNDITGNLIGTTGDGQSPMPNNGNGILLHGSKTLIGGNSDIDRNTISGNDLNGIAIVKDGNSGPNDGRLNLIANNLIGTNFDGSQPIGNSGAGILIADGANSNYIGNYLNRYGDSVPGTGNVISSNGSAGIFIQTDENAGEASDHNLITGNQIGMNGGVTAALPNQLSGIIVDDSPENFVGSTNKTAEANVIAGNTEHGVYILGGGSTNNFVQNNLVGISADAAIFGNGIDGIRVESAPGTVVENNNVGGNLADGITATNISLARPAGIKLTPTRHAVSLLEGDALATGIRRSIVSEMTKTLNTPTDTYSLRLAHNKIGATQTGEIYTPAPNQFGIKLVNVDDAIIGDAADHQNGNLIGASAVDGILLDHSSRIEILNNYVGTSPAASTNLGPGQNGIHVTNSSSFIDISSNTVGGAPDSGIKIEDVGTFSPTCSAPERPFSPPFPGVRLSGNYVAVVIEPAKPVVKVPNHTGIWISNTGQVTLGKITDSNSNVVSGNIGAGITIQGTSNVDVKRAFVGALPPGVQLPRGNGNRPNLPSDFGNGGDGILIAGGASGNSIGGPETGSGNVIANNGGSGVRVDPTAGGCNLIDPNSISGNSGLGIDIGSPGFSWNDAGDADASPGGNPLQNYPEITDFALDGNGDLIVSYKVDSIPGNSTSGYSNYGALGLYVEFFKSDDTGEGIEFFGYDYYTAADHAGSLAGIKTKNLGNGAALGFNQGDLLTGTATDANNNTSEFFPVVVPSAAEVSVAGTVRYSDGRPVRNAVVTLTDGSGVTKRAISNAFGAYRFDYVEAGRTYVLTTQHKSLQFVRPSFVLTVDDAVEDADFIVME